MGCEARDRFTGRVRGPAGAGGEPRGVGPAGLGAAPRADDRNRGTGDHEDVRKRGRAMAYITLFDNGRFLGDYNLPETVTGDGNDSFRLSYAFPGGGNGVVFDAR